MPFQQVGSRVNFPEMEERILRFWNERDIFAKSVRQREGAPLFILYEGPPTANGRPGIHHVLARVFKDIIPRYKTMKGFQAPRKGGWDTHGLPVELEVERELGITSKPEIEQYGIAAFNERCRASVFRYVQDWEAMTERIAFWVDLESAYVTYHNSYIESNWWILKQMWDQGLVYLGYKTTPHCPRCGTSLSSHEVALGYKDDTVDPSVTFKLELDRAASAGHPALAQLPDDGVPTSLLVWTTTPWTLPGNVAVAVNPDAWYAVVEVEGDRRERLIVAAALLDANVPGERREVTRVQGHELAGLRYQPLFQPAAFGSVVQQMVKVPAGSAAELEPRPVAPGEHLSYPVIVGDFVSLEDGTGMVHIAPAFGEDDFQTGKTNGLLFIQPVDLAGKMTIGTDALPINGLFVKEADPLIVRFLQEQGRIHRVGTITHTYPFCWRCDTPLLYYVKTSWYIRTSARKEQLIANNQQINWRPEHIRDGRFGDWLEHNVDWALSRERYWGTPLPIWRCGSCGHTDCVGGVADLQGRRGYEGPLGEFDLHRPYVDEPTFTCEQCGGRMKRVPELMDVWFDSGAMPISQWHYPFENQDTFQKWFPADYICEAVDQTRGWFYTLHAISTLLFDAPTYRNVICLGLILDEKGEKMSKSKGNVVDPWTVLNAHGADALRWYLYTATPPGNARRFSVDLVGETLRKFLLTLWNTYSFFTIYASIDGWTPPPHSPMPQRREAGPGERGRSELDRWVLARLHQTVRDVTVDLDDYNPTDAGRAIQQFVDDLSNWYVRRSRRRFWKSENDQDKHAAYATLYECLVTVTKLIAPFTPFVAEELYQNLVRAVDPAAPESVHLADYPEADPALIDAELLAGTELVMRLASLGRSARSKAQIKVRQPLGELRVLVRQGPKHDQEAAMLQALAPQLADELNVKHIAVGAGDPAFFRSAVAVKREALNRFPGPLRPRIMATLRDAPQEQATAWLEQVETGEAIMLRIGDEDVVLAPEDVTATVDARPGWAVAAEAGYVVGVSTAVSQELADEGLVRELVHRLQTMRRSANFDIADHIVTYVASDQHVVEVLHRYAEYVRQETLSRELVLGHGTDLWAREEAYTETQQVEGHEVTMAVRRA